MEAFVARRSAMLNMKDIFSSANLRLLATLLHAMILIDCAFAYFVANVFPFYPYNRLVGAACTFSTMLLTVAS